MITIQVEQVGGKLFYRDRKNPNWGWFVREDILDGKRVITPLDYVRRPL
jgi:hypothetical protein